MLSHFLRPAAPITFIGSAFDSSGGASVLSYAQSVPSGRTGDMLVFVAGKNTASGVYSTPSGWTSLGAGARSAFFYKTATANSEADFTATVTIANVVGGVVLRFRFASKAPVIGSITTLTIAGPSTITATAVSAQAADYVLQCFVDGGSSKSYSVPSVSNGTLFTDSDGNQPSSAIFYQYNGSSNATSTKTGTSSVVDAVQIRLRK